MQHDVDWAAADWDSANGEYLALSLEWLRHCLRQEREAMHAAMARRSALVQQMHAVPALEWLARRLGMSSFERDLLLLCAAVEFDPGMALLCAAMADGPGHEYPNFAVALACLPEPSWDALSPARPLRHWHLIEVAAAGVRPLTASPLRADERIVHFIKGLNQLDERLAAVLTPLPEPSAEVPLTTVQAELAASIAAQWLSAAEDETLPVVQLLGHDALARQMVAAQACSRLGVRMLRLGGDLLPTQAGEVELLARLWARECVLMPLALYVDPDEGQTAAAASDALPAGVRHLLAHTRGMAFLAAPQALPRCGRAHVAYDVSSADSAEQQAAWSAALGAGALAERLAAQFNLNQWDIRRIARACLAQPAQDGQMLDERLWEACRLNARPRLDQLAQRLDAKAQWADLVLPAEETAVLRQITAQLEQRGTVYGRWGFARSMNRGLGISALFAGDSGTGKTMAAEVIANALRLSLYRIDLSAVVSKYIGETEKNLARLFDGAEDGGAVLFFDEADALFGKRSEVNDSHDRFANIEINYLLQRIEAFRGVAILATNMKSALDAAFLRRLRFIVRFPFPRAADRSRIWARAFPPQTPLLDLDFEHLGRLNLTGGNIHSAALNAAFLAATAGSAVTMPLVLAAVRSEYLKLERPVNETDFRWLATDQGAA
ncbi:MAG: ATP-binding protein [Pseudomonadota bacterium]|nr:ATP-binding protein [Pseudomonadota bacterium]